MYRIVFKSKGQIEEYLSTDFGEVTDKILELKMKHYLWFVRGMCEEKEGSTTTGLLLFCKSFKLII